MNNGKKQMIPETDFPVMKMSMNMIMLDGNAASLPIMQHWNCKINSPVPKMTLQKHPEIMEAATKGSECFMNVQYKDIVIRFTVMPFPEAGYVGFYGYQVERCEKPVNMFEGLN